MYSIAQMQMQAMEFMIRYEQIFTQSHDGKAAAVNQFFGAY